MNYWIIKSEPFKYSWDELVADKWTYWDGVRSYEARNNMKKMEVGDFCMFYHSNKGLEIVGVARVIKEAYPDPTIEDDRWAPVDIEPVKELKNYVTLKQMKADENLVDLKLIRQGRLSVSPCTKEQYDTIMEHSK